MESYNAAVIAAMAAAGAMGGYLVALTIEAFGESVQILATIF